MKFISLSIALLFVAQTQAEAPQNQVCILADQAAWKIDPASGNIDLIVITCDGQEGRFRMNIHEYIKAIREQAPKKKPDVEV